MKNAVKKTAATSLLVCLAAGGILAACGGSDSSTSSTGQAKLLIDPASVKISISAGNVSASSTDGANVPGNAVDGNLATHWTGAAASGTQSLTFKLGACYTTDFINVSWYQGDARQYNFTVEASADGGSTWTTVKTATSAGTSAALVQTDFPNTVANTMRLSSTGNSVNTKVSINDVEFWGKAGGTCSGGSGTTTTTKAGGTTTTTKTTTTTTGSSGGTYSAATVLAGIKKNMVSSKQVNTLAHINTMTHSAVNVYQVDTGVYAYSAGMAVDTDGSDPDPDPDHQGSTTWSDNSGKSLGAHTVPFFVLGDDCWDRKSPCPHFYYAERNIKGLQFALFFYNGKVIGGVFGDTQTANNQTTSDNDSRELGEASAKAASLLGIPSSGTTGGVDSGVTYVIFSGSEWVIKGSSSSALNTNAQAVVQKALNKLGVDLGL